MTEKNLRIERNPRSLLWRIRWEGGGQLPSDLTGEYTSVAKAEEQIARWKASSERTPDVTVKQHKDKR